MASRYFFDKLQTGLLQWASSFSFDSDNQELKKQINKAFTWLQHGLVIKTAGLRSCRAGFSTGAYLRALAHAEIDFSPATDAKQQPADVNTQDLQHQELFQALKAWRAKQAGNEEVEHYRILHQRVLIQIAETLPDTVEALLPIKGIGKRTAEKYGESITAIVREYCRAHNIEPQQRAPQPTVANKTEPDTRRISYELYLQGKSIKEIAGERGLVTNTIEGHLAHYVRLGLMDIGEILAEEKISLIKNAFDNKGTASLKVVKEYLGDAFSYGEIRLVRESLR